MLILSVIFVESLIYVFFFKQKTAYEMRISDWSSDVCSSDLARQLCRQWARRRRSVVDRQPDDRAGDRRAARRFRAGDRSGRAAVAWAADAGRRPGDRKSTRPELQSLMRISYDVFCLKKKTCEHYTYINHSDL